LRYDSTDIKLAAIGFTFGFSFGVGLLGGMLFEVGIGILAAVVIYWALQRAKILS
jgi:hypothetical protein